MKVIAMYLPQFHRVLENDEWWGEGFTDWVSTKKAKPLFEDHYQPHVPKDDNYYDLLQKSTMVWQEYIMQRYGIDGLCIYHYWFDNGRKILEKPAENLLNWKDVNIPFCFCWANETWARSWSNIPNANSWVFEQSKEVDRETPSVLLAQHYGEEMDWREHFNYLLPFFKDSRYMRVGRKPIFVIYKPNDIPCLNEMMRYWNQLASSVSLDGIYLVGINCDEEAKSVMDAELWHEPSHGLRNLPKLRRNDGLLSIEYDEVWKAILSERNSSVKKTYYGGFVGYDDTPRRGITGMVVNHSTPQKFQRYLFNIMVKNYVNGNELTFINAWNEWGEGMHLEPDERYNTLFLEAVKTAKNNLNKFNIDTCFPYEEPSLMTNKKNECERYIYYLRLFDLWMTLRNKNVHIANFLYRRNVKKIIVYGGGLLGRHFVDDVFESDIEIVGIIDRNKGVVRPQYVAFLPTDELPHFDAMIVTAAYYMKEICNLYKGKRYKIISIETILKELYDDFIL